MNTTALLLLIALLAVAGVLLLLWSTRLRRKTGLPAGTVVYSDTGAWERCEVPLTSLRYGLTGRPDYLVLVKGATIPVEVKSSRRPVTPYRSHLMQLAAYCLLIEDTRGPRPPYGLLSYRDATLRVDYTDRLRAELLKTLSQMERVRKRGDAARSHDEPARCRSCGYSHACDERLVD
ncbi:MAG TPA: CRISPR-associated protein Cas4 [Anaerolineae bacterium]|nr:CRISPR-associated protein Cas4 [Anaerolineae bacterium]